MTLPKNGDLLSLKAVSIYQEDHEGRILLFGDQMAAEMSQSHSTSVFREAEDEDLR